MNADTTYQALCARVQTVLKTKFVALDEEGSAIRLIGPRGTCPIRIAIKSDAISICVGHTEKQMELPNSRLGLEFATQALDSIINGSIWLAHRRKGVIKKRAELLYCFDGKAYVDNIGVIDVTPGGATQILAEFGKYPRFDGSQPGAHSKNVPPRIAVVDSRADDGPARVLNTLLPYVLKRVGLTDVDDYQLVDHGPSELTIKGSKGHCNLVIEVGSEIIVSFPPARGCYSFDPTDSGLMAVTRIIESVLVGSAAEKCHERSMSGGSLRIHTVCDGLIFDRDGRERCADELGFTQLLADFAPYPTEPR